MSKGHRPVIVQQHHHHHHRRFSTQPCSSSSPPSSSKTSSSADPGSLTNGNSNASDVDFVPRTFDPQSRNRLTGLSRLEAAIAASLQSEIFNCSPAEAAAVVDDGDPVAVGNANPCESNNPKTKTSVTDDLVYFEDHRLLRTTTGENNNSIGCLHDKLNKLNGYAGRTRHHQLIKDSPDFQARLLACRAGKDRISYNSHRAARQLLALAAQRGRPQDQDQDRDEDDEDDEDEQVRLRDSSGNIDSRNKEAEAPGQGSSGRTAASYCTMVAAMNELLSSSSATSTIRTTTAGIVKDCKFLKKDYNLQENSAAAISSIDSLGHADIDSVNILSFPGDFDHMYASMTDGSTPVGAASALGASPLQGGNEVASPENDISEVKHLRELLILHLDLIQQQSEQLNAKEKLLAAYKQENDSLKLRIERMKGFNLQPKSRSDNNENSSDFTGSCSPQDFNSGSNPSTSENYNEIPETAPMATPQHNESLKIRLNTSGGITTVKQEPPMENNPILDDSDWHSKKKRKSDPIGLNNAKRKRGISSSSSAAYDPPAMIHQQQQDIKNVVPLDIAKDEKEDIVIKKDSFLSTKEFYYTAVGDPNFILNLKETPEDNSTNLEVPNWRIKTYTSCYTMEGTENLDDDIFNKRHVKLENDERRRKRWDFQRMREQKHVEKLKQRQERVNNNANSLNNSQSGACPGAEEEKITSLWPELDQIQHFQVDDILPVSAFGEFIPIFTESDFRLPWLNDKKSKDQPKNKSSKRKSMKR